MKYKFGGENIYEKECYSKIWLFIIVALLFIATGVIANAEENNEVCLEHNYIETVTPATLFEDGKITFKCDILCRKEEHSYGSFFKNV